MQHNAPSILMFGCVLCFTLLSIQALKSGDQGFVGRVPKASNKDYIVPSKWNVDKEVSRKVNPCQFDCYLIMAANLRCVCPLRAS